MTTVSMFLPSMSGTAGNTLWLYKSSDFSLVNTGGDALTESGTSGWFTADVAEEWTETLSATVLDTNSLASGYGWLAVGSTQIVDATAVLDSAVQEKLDATWKYGDVIEFSDADSGETESHRITTAKIS